MENTFYNIFWLYRIYSIIRLKTFVKSTVEETKFDSGQGTYLESKICETFTLTTAYGSKRDS